MRSWDWGKQLENRALSTELMGLGERGAFLAVPNRRKALNFMDLLTKTFGRREFEEFSCHESDPNQLPGICCAPGVDHAGVESPSLEVSKELLQVSKALLGW